MLSILTVTKKQIIFFLLTLFILFFTAIAIAWFYAPPIPKKITLAVRSSGGFSYQFAVDFKKAMKEASNIEVEIQETAGSVANIKLLSSPKSGVDLAIVNTGAVNPDNYPELKALAGVYYLPYWVWYRSNAFKGELISMHQLKGKRFSIGPNGSGDEKLSRDILKLNEINDDEIKLLNLPFAKAISELSSGGIDAVALVDGVGSPSIEKYKNIQGIRIMNFSEADAYSRSMPSLTKIVLPQSNISFKNHLPDKDIQLITTKAVLVSRSDINPGLVNEIMYVLDDKFRNYTRLQNAEEFPSNQGLDFRQQEDAQIYMKDGPTFLYKHLPAWLAVWVGRILAIIIPLAILIVPLRTIVPALIQAPLRFNMGKSYLEMKQLELDVHNAEKNNLPLSDFELLSKRLDVFEGKVNKLKVPALETEQYFNLKANIDVIRNRIRIFCQK